MNIMKNINEELNKNILVVDVESTCWENDQEKGDQKNEIFQIGMTAVNNDKITNIKDIKIKPQYSSISNFCKNLTGMTQEKIDKEGVSIKEGYNAFKDIISQYSTWASWGKYDYNQISKMCELYNIPQVAQKDHINIRELFAKKILGSDNPHDAPNNPKIAMEQLGLKFEGRNHDGADDALNIAKLFVAINKHKAN